MAVSLALLLVGGVGMLVDSPAFRMLLLLGAAGCAITVARCVQFARHSDLTGLPRIGARSTRQSRSSHRGLIALLHLIHPMARALGRIRGLSSMPHASAPEHTTRRAWKAPLPGLWDVLRAARLAIGCREGRSFWSETWVGHAELLTEIVGQIRAARPAPLVEIDEGWRADRDFSLAVGRWGWLHVLTLTEEHARGRCLFRVHTRLRLSLIGSVQALLIAVALAAGSVVAMSLHRPSGRILSVAALLLLGLRTAWQVTRASTVLDRALVRAVGEAGMSALPGSTTEPAVPIAPALAAPLTEASEEARAAPGV
jgi:hypothetical protein